MDGVELLTMDPAEAQTKLDTYREALKRRADETVEQMAKVYAEAAKGRPIVDLADVFRDPPRDDRGRPRLAVARSDKSEVRATIYRNQITFDARRGWSGSTRTNLIRTFRTEPIGDYRGAEIVYALVPFLPPEHRPATGQRRDWLILWEVDEWSERPRTAAPSRDPYLLKPLDGTLCAVLAAWDLTDLEIAVLKGLSRR